MKPYPVRVVWVDSCSLAGWHDPGTIDTEPMVITSYGWLVEKTDKKIVFATSKADNETFGQFSTVPRSCVVKMRRIK